MTLNTETWNKDLGELINYDSTDFSKNTMQIKESGYIYRLQNHIVFIKDEINLEDYEKLIEINKTENTFQLLINKNEIIGTENIDTFNSTWFVLKKYKTDDNLNKYKIHAGDIIKIGRIITKIKDIKYSNKKYINKNENQISENEKSDFDDKSSLDSKINDKLVIKKIENIKNEKATNNIKQKIISLVDQRNSTEPDLNDKIQILNLNKNIKLEDKDEADKKEIKILNKNNIKIKNKKKAVCRICYIEEEDGIENPLIQPCKCSGSLKFIHLKCLKQWILTKCCMKVEEGECYTIYSFSEVECEICKTKLPDIVNHNGKLISLMDFTDDFKNYFILETLTYDEEENKFLYIISLDKTNELKLGRGILNEILLSDVSISRIHCTFIIDGKNIYLRDNNSKFGTLALVQTPTITMIEGLPLSIQIGKTYLNFEIKKNYSFFSCCGVSEKPNIYFFYKQNEKQINLNRIFSIKNETEECTYSDEEYNENNENKDNNENMKNQEIKSKESEKKDSVILIVENE